MQQVEMLKCPCCGEFTLHPKRREMGFFVCVNCSTTKPVVGITTVEGTGDHTYNDIIIMDQEQAVNIYSRVFQCYWHSKCRLRHSKCLPVFWTHARRNKI